jgi:hypothetical protein
MGVRAPAATGGAGVSARQIVVVSVVLCVVAFEVWFFFFAGSSIGHN